MKSYRLSELSDAEVSGLKARPRIDFSSIFGTVRWLDEMGTSHGIEVQYCFIVAWEPWCSVLCNQVNPIVEDVRVRGDDAVKE
jgi:hypothetical protein